jgi:hypothetical protein
VGGAVLRALSLLFDLLLFASLAILITGLAGGDLVFLAIILVLAGVIAQALFLRRFRVGERWRLRLPLMAPAAALANTKLCSYCNRAISADANICRYCLTSVDAHLESAAQAAPQAEMGDLQSQTRRWQAGW